MKRHRTRSGKERGAGYYPILGLEPNAVEILSGVGEISISQGSVIGTINKKVLWTRMGTPHSGIAWVNFSASRPLSTGTSGDKLLVTLSDIPDISPIPGGGHYGALGSGSILFNDVTELCYWSVLGPNLLVATTGGETGHINDSGLIGTAYGETPAVAWGPDESENGNAGLNGTLVYPTGPLAFDGSSEDDNAVVKLTRVVTPEELMSLEENGASAVEIIPAPGAGKAIVPMFASLAISPGGWDTSTSDGYGIFFVLGDSYVSAYFEDPYYGTQFESTILPSSVDSGYGFAAAPLLGFAIFDMLTSDWDNLPFSIVTGDTWESGTTPLTVTVWYKVVSTT